MLSVGLHCRLTGRPGGCGVGAVRPLRQGHKERLVLPADRHRPPLARAASHAGEVSPRCRVSARAGPGL